MDEKTVIRGGHVISMEPGRPEVEQADVLIEGGKIVEVGLVGRVDARTIDATAAIVLPGLIDTHRHLWQTTLRAHLADWTLNEYMRGVRFSIAPVITDEDAYIANRIGGLEALNAGVTSIFDYSHNIQTPAHADASAEALLSTGIGGIFGYGFVGSPDGHPSLSSIEARVSDAERVKSQYFAGDDAVMVMGAALTEVGLIPFSETRKEIEAARVMALTVQSIHDGMYHGSAIGHGILRLGAAGLLGPEMVVVHGNAMREPHYALLRDHGCAIAHTPDTELQMGMGHPVIAQAREYGITSSVGCDIVSSNGGDLIGQVRLGLQDARSRGNDEFVAVNSMVETLELTSHEALSWATLSGATALNLERRTGSIAVGKDADVIVIRAVGPNLWPFTPAPGTVVLHSHPSDVSEVMVKGRLVKEGGRLIGVDYAAERAAAERSAERLHKAACQTYGQLLPPLEALSLGSIEETARQNLEL